MSSFTKPLIVTPMPDGKSWELVEPFEYYIDDPYGEKIIVPEGFRTDFASIPRFAWSIIGTPWGKYGKAAVIHDWCYYKTLYTRKKCDKIFLEGMKTLGVGWLKRRTMWLAVRIGAGKIWRKYSQQVE